MNNLRSQLKTINKHLSKTQHELELFNNIHGINIIITFPDKNVEILETYLNDNETYLYLAGFEKGLIFGKKLK